MAGCGVSKTSSARSPGKRAHASGGRAGVDGESAQHTCSHVPGAIDRTPVHARRGERRPARDARARADGDRARSSASIFRTYSGARRGQPEPFPLADGEPVNAPVRCPSVWPRSSTIAPVRATCGVLPCHERGVVAVRHEADLLAVRLLGHGQAKAPRLRRAPRGLVSDPTGNSARGRAAPASARTGSTTGPSRGPRCASAATVRPRAWATRA